MSDEPTNAELIFNRLLSALGNEVDEVDAVFAISGLLGVIIDASPNWTAPAATCAIVDYFASCEDRDPLAFLGEVTKMHVRKAAERGNSKAAALLDEMTQRTSGPRIIRRSGASVQRVLRRHRRPR